MGEARRRGSREERVAEARARQLKEEPINVPCKTCDEVLNGFDFLSSSPAGAAWQKKCKCGAITTALVQAENSTLERTFRKSLGMADKVTDPENKNKVTVSFLEKNLDTIETGLIRL